MDPSRKRTLHLLLGALGLATGTPIVLALTRPGLRGYLLQPEIIAGQCLPYVLAALLWLPWRAPDGIRAGQVLAGLLLLSAVLLYIPVLTGLLPTGGDMVGLGYLLIAAVTTAAIPVLTVAALGLLWFRHRSAGR